MTDREARLNYYNEYWNTGIDKYGDGCGDRQRVRYLLAAKLISRSKGTLLDIGCGNGGGSLSLQSQGFAVTGIDLSKVGVAKARKKGLEAIVCDVEADNIPGEYDVIVCLEVLEHLQFPLKVLEKLRRNLSRDGELIISFPNEFHLLRRLLILTGKQDFSRYDYPHLRFFDRKEAYRLIVDAGYVLQVEHSIPLPPPRMQMLTTICQLFTEISPELFSIGFVFRIVPER